MKRLLASLLLLAACGDPSPTPESPDAGIDPDAEVSDLNGTIDVAWQLQDDGDPATCPAGATTAAVHVLLEGDSEAYVDLYNCADLAGSVADIPAGEYDVWVDLTDDSGVTLYAQSESSHVTLAAGATESRTFAIDVANGFVDVSWRLLIPGGGASTTCAAQIQSSVSVLSTQTDSNTGYDDIYQCTDGESPAKVTTGALPLGPYTTVLTMLAGDEPIGSSDPVSFSIDHGTEFEDLGTIEIEMF